MIGELWTGKDAEGSGCGLTESTGWAKSHRAHVRSRMWVRMEVTM